MEMLEAELVNGNKLEDDNLLNQLYKNESAFWDIWFKYEPVVYSECNKFGLNRYHDTGQMMSQVMVHTRKKLLNNSRNIPNWYMI